MPFHSDFLHVSRLTPHASRFPCRGEAGLLGNTLQIRVHLCSSVVELLFLDLSVLSAKSVVPTAGFRSTFRVLRVFRGLKRRLWVHAVVILAAPPLSGATRSDPPRRTSRPKHPELLQPWTGRKTDPRWRCLMEAATRRGVRPLAPTPPATRRAAAS